MFDIDRWREVMYSLVHHKFRTILTSFGVFWGIFILTILMGVNAGFEFGVMRNFQGMLSSVLAVWGQNTSKPYHGLPVGRSIILTEDDMYLAKENIEEIALITATTQPRTRAPQVRYKENSKAFEVVGMYPDAAKIYAYGTKRGGRFINEHDISKRRNVAVIGKEIVDILFKGDDPVGKYINISNQAFQVVGILHQTLESESFNFTNYNEKRTVMLPNNVLRNMYNMGGSIGFFIYVPKKGTNVELVEKKVKAFLAKRHKIDPEDKEALGSFNMNGLIGPFTALLTGLDLFSILVGVFTLIGGIIGVSSIMLITIQERTKEFGVRKALGATSRNIIGQILQESVLITALSGYFGLAISVLIFEVIRMANVETDFFSEPQVSVSLAVGTLCLLVISGIIAGIIPANHAVKIKPIEALRYE